jgi:hypothetical protein
VIAPRVEGNGLMATILNDNQFGIIVQANSGLPFNIRSNRDLNDDGFTNDRPNGIARNSRDLGSVFNVDLRYSRFLALNERVRFELFAEAKNILNSANPRSVNSVVQTDTTGNLMSPLPDVFDATNFYESRQLQFGAKVTF